MTIVWAFLGLFLIAVIGIAVVYAERALATAKLEAARSSVASSPAVPTSSPTIATRDAVKFDPMKLPYCTQEDNLRYIDVMIRVHEDFTKTTIWIVVQAHGSPTYVPADTMLPAVDGTRRARVHVPNSEAIEVIAVTMSDDSSRKLGEFADRRTANQAWNIETALPTDSLELNRTSLNGCLPLSTQQSSPGSNKR